MRRFEAEKQIKGRIYSKVTLIILLVLILLLLRGVFTLYLRNKESAVAREETEKKVTELRERKGVLGTEIEKLNQEDGIEEEIREKFNVVKPGENVVIVVPEEIATTTEVKLGLWTRFWRWIW